MPAWNELEKTGRLRARSCHLREPAWFPSSEADGDAFELELARQGLSFYEQKPLPHRGYHAHIVESWDRCLNLDWYARDIAEPFAEKSIQATVWEITMDHVAECRRFTAR